MAHLGFAATIIGIAITATQSVERDMRMLPQDTVELAGMEVTFLGVKAVDGPNYRAQQGVFVVSHGSGNFSLRPEKRRYLSGGNVMTEAGIHAGWFGDTYIALGEPLDPSQGAWAVRLHYKPLVRWIWLGAVLMALGGMLAILIDVIVRCAHGNSARLWPRLHHDQSAALCAADPVPRDLRRGLCRIQPE